ncbi:hypothetical protein BJV78DRAFT_469625 [Lactifluus subvellereus]|nr:hypothetical protein BJV78DRAFT_469625 [Lactifluus subvellereus]
MLPIVFVFCIMHPWLLLHRPPVSLFRLRSLRELHMTFRKCNLGKCIIPFQSSTVSKRLNALLRPVLGSLANDERPLRDRINKGFTALP